MGLGFVLQSLAQLLQLLLPFCFGFLPQRALNANAFLQITLLELLARAIFQAKTGIAQKRFRFAPALLAQDPLACAQSILLLRTHAQPTLGVTLKNLTVLRR